MLLVNHSEVIKAPRATVAVHDPVGCWPAGTAPTYPVVVVPVAVGGAVCAAGSRPLSFDAQYGGTQVCNCSSEQSGVTR